jgi:hypothetical protein
MRCVVPQINEVKDKIATKEAELIDIENEFSVRGMRMYCAHACMCGHMYAQTYVCMHARTHSARGTDAPAHTRTDSVFSVHTRLARACGSDARWHAGPPAAASTQRRVCSHTGRLWPCRIGYATRRRRSSARRRRAPPCSSSSRTRSKTSISSTPNRRFVRARVCACVRACVRACVGCVSVSCVCVCRRNPSLPCRPQRGRLRSALASHHSTHCRGRRVVCAAAALGWIRRCACECASGRRCRSGARMSSCNVQRRVQHAPLHILQHAAMVVAGAAQGRA